MTFADDDVMRKQLREPFPKEQIGKLPATQKRPALDFVGHAAVTDRLNQAAPDWTYSIDEVTRARYVDENGMERNGPYWIRGTLTVGGVSRVEYGDGGDPKEAIGNFIRRAAMRFGVALDLWSREDLGSAKPDAGDAAEPTSPALTTGEGEAQVAPSPAGDTTSDDPALDEPATDDQWKRANAHGLTMTKGLKRARERTVEGDPLFPEAPRAGMEITKRQLAALIQEALG